MKKTKKAAIIVVFALLIICIYFLTQDKEAAITDYSSSMSASMYIYKYGDNELNIEFSDENVYICMLVVSSDDLEVNNGDYNFYINLENIEDSRLIDFENNSIYTEEILSSYIELNPGDYYDFFVFSEQPNFDYSTLTSYPVKITDQDNNESEIYARVIAKLGEWS